jgi:hypothetical protein
MHRIGSRYDPLQLQHGDQLLDRGDHAVYSVICKARIKLHVTENNNDLVFVVLA